MELMRTYASLPYSAVSTPLQYNNYDRLVYTISVSYSVHWATSCKGDKAMMMLMMLVK